MYCIYHIQALIRTQQKTFQQTKVSSGQRIATMETLNEHYSKVGSKCSPSRSQKKSEILFEHIYIIIRNYQTFFRYHFQALKCNENIHV